MCLASRLGLFVLTVLFACPIGTSGQTFVTVDFQDEAPPDMVWTSGGGGSRELVPANNSAATCAEGARWSYTRVASGGYKDRGYYEQRWCAYRTSRATGTWPSGWSGTGFNFEPGGTRKPGQNNWPATTFFGRMRIFFDSAMTLERNGSRRRQLKFFMWHRDVFDGDQRVIGFLESGSNCGRRDTTHVCFTLQRNVFNNSDTATVALPLHTWHHVQWSWKHGVEGASYLKIWANNNDESRPTAQDTRLNPDPPPAEPGGTTEWVKANRGYDAPFHFGENASEGTAFREDFVIRVMDFQLGGSFDEKWAPSDSKQAR
jgi:hypothetical protein